MPAFLFVIALWIAVVGSWIANIVKLVSLIGTDVALLTLLPVLRIVGIFAFPLGCVMGFVPN